MIMRVLRGCLRSSSLRVAVAALAIGAGSASGEVVVEDVREFPGPDPASWRLFGCPGMRGGTWMVGEVRYSNRTGRVHVYAGSETGQTWVASLDPSDSRTNLEFGSDSAIEGETALVGAFSWDEEGEPWWQNRGACYEFSCSGGAWTQVCRFTAVPPTNSDYFGVGVALDGDTAYVGAMGPESTNSGLTGYIQIFSRCSTGWVGGSRIYAPAEYRDAGDSFGNDIALDEDTAVVGAWRDDPTNALGQVLTNAGAAYVYDRDGTNWAFVARLTADDAAIDDGYGESVAIADNVIFIGAHRVDIGTTQNIGAVYVYETNSLGEWVPARPRFMPANGKAGDNFGVRIAAESNLLLAGAWTTDRDTYTDCGSVYVYTFTSQPPAVVSNEGFAYDGFNGYAEGSLEGCSNSGEAGSTGWSGSWSNAFGCVVKDAGTPLLYGHAASGIGVSGGERVLAVTGGVPGAHALTALRGLALDVNAATNLYVSFLLRAVSVPASGVTNLLSVGPGLAAAGAPYAGVLGADFYASTRAAPAGALSSGFGAATTFFVVARFEAAGGAYNWDRARLYVNPTSAVLPQAEQEVEDTGGTPAREGSLRVATGNYGGGNEYWIDEIRAGTNWPSVAPLADPASDADGDGLPDDWELRYFGGLTNAVAGADPDEDGCDNRCEHVAVTIPTNAASFFRITSARWATNAMEVLFDGATSRCYGLESATGLMTGTDWAPVPGQTNITGAGPGSMTLTDTNAASERAFYRVGVALP